MSYAQENAGFITRSKLKEFQRCPYAYHLRYIEEAEPKRTEETKRRIKLGLCFDDLISYGKKYIEDNWEFRTKKKGEEAPENLLTASSRETVFTGAMEFDRQDISDTLGQYEKQKTVEIQITDEVVLKGTMDRFSEEKRLIRDTKMTGSVITFDPQNYLDQASFYFFLVKEKYGIECEFILDVADHQGRSIFYRYTKDDLRGSCQWIGKTLAEFVKAERSGEYEANQGFRRRNCFSCDFYSRCPHSKQEEFYDL